MSPPEFVISGAAGRFPFSGNLDEFWENLVLGKDMIGERIDRFGEKVNSVLPPFGYLNNVDKFDAEFFLVNGKQADVMDPRLRFALELTHEALIDAGVNPFKVRGGNTCVLVGSSGEDAGAILKRSLWKPNDYTIITGTSACMFSNRISFNFDFNGPSCTIDTGCSSSLVAMQTALLTMRSGISDSAIVAGLHMIFCPTISIIGNHIGLLSREGKCKSFDASASGFARSEAAAVLFLCNQDRAKRTYAKIVHAKYNSDGYKTEGVTCPSSLMQERLLKEVYEECDVSPLDINYVEMHGSSTRSGDIAEAKAVAAVLCAGRNGPLLIGSTKSNMGHAEPASGIVGIVKVLLSHRFGLIPANLHFQIANPDIPALLDHQLEVVAKNTPLCGKYVAINSFGFGGTNAHMVLKFEPKNNFQALPASIPILLPISGRTYDCIQYQLAQLSTQCDNAGMVGLIHEVYRYDTPRHFFRGYAIQSSLENETHIKMFSNSCRKHLWFIYSGLGSDWKDMGSEMSKFKAFRNSLEESAVLLQKQYFDLSDALEAYGNRVANPLQNSTVTITVIQIALTDLLSSLGLQPDGIVGYCLGEIASAYADNCLTHEQTLSVSMAISCERSISVVSAGAMANVPLSWNEVSKRCLSFPGVYPAIHNSFEDVTIAGPPDMVRSFISALSNDGVICQGIDSAFHAYHTDHMRPLEVRLREMLYVTIPSPKLRSAAWLSTSIEPSRWDSDLARTCSGEYFVNNALNPVWFYETLEHLPENVIAVEIAPHRILQKYIKRNLKKPSLVTAMMDRSCKATLTYFLNTLGQLYLEGLNFDTAKLYDPVAFPVDASTPSLSSMIKWDHSHSWSVPNMVNQSSANNSRFLVDLTHEEMMFLNDRVINGEILFPESGILVFVWEAFAGHHQSSIDSFEIVFDSVEFRDRIRLSKGRSLDFLVSIFPATGSFEVSVNGDCVANGFVHSDEGREFSDLRLNEINTDGALSNEGCYKELQLRGYQLSGPFRGIDSIDLNRTWAKIKWKHNWISFLDSAFLTNSLRFNSRETLLPLRLEKLVIRPTELKQCLAASGGTVTLNLFGSRKSSQCMGLEFQRLLLAPTEKREVETFATLAERAFIPFYDPDKNTCSRDEILEFFCQIATDNFIDNRFILTEILSTPDESIPKHPYFFCNARFEDPEFRMVLISDAWKYSEEARNFSALVSLEDLQLLEKSHLIFTVVVDVLLLGKELLRDGGFLMFEGNFINEQPSWLQTVSRKSTSGCWYHLFRRTVEMFPCSFQIVALDTPDFGFIETVRASLNSNRNERLVIASGNISGVLGFVKTLRLEHNTDNIRCIYEPWKKNGHAMERWNSISKFDLAFNVFKDGKWGCYGNKTFTQDALRQTKACADYHLHLPTASDLSSLQWLESPLRLHNKQYCQVWISGLNPNSLPIANGHGSRTFIVSELAYDGSVLGSEFAGIYDSRRVFGLCKRGSGISAFAKVEAALTFNVPQVWSISEAATVPSAYLAAYFALVLAAGFKRGQCILIHGGAGEVSHAAITLALNADCTIFTTVESRLKGYIIHNFPRLNSENVINLRSDFESEILEKTGGKGVDIVLNSLTSKNEQSALRCLRKFGVYLEIRRTGMAPSLNLQRALFIKQVVYYPISMDFQKNVSPNDMFQLRNLLEAGIASGTVRPFAYVKYSHENIEKAFRSLAQGEDSRKVIVEMLTLVPVNALCRTYFNKMKVYVVIGGLGGVGLEVSYWMVQRNVRLLVLNARHGITSAYQKYRIKVLEELGATVVIDQTDASTKVGALRLMQSVSSLGEVGGIFNAALALSDGMFDGLSPENFEQVCNPKSDVTRQLDDVTRALGIQLDYFVVFSSLVSSFGTIGQSNYGYANSLMEQICEHRKRDGLHANAIQWGVISDVGIMSEDPKGSAKVPWIIPQSIGACVETLDVLLNEDITVSTSCVFAKKASAVRKNTSLLSTICEILCVDVASTNQNMALIDLGLDSLMVSEIRSALVLHNIELPLKSLGKLKLKDIALLEQRDLP